MLKATIRWRDALGLNHGLNITEESGFRFLWLVVSEDYNLQDLLAQISFAEEH